MMNLPKEFKAIIDDIYPNGLDWSLVGILTKKSEVYTLSYDSKILSKIFEILCEPIVYKIAGKYNLKVEKAAQTIYPEFTLIDEFNPNKKIAIDIKSTYRKFNNDGGIRPFSFTLGSYRSFLRNEKKNILYPYSQYIEHWIIGFVYTRNLNCEKVEIKSIIEAANLEIPYNDIEYFVQEKFKIAGKTPGSGNTTNIGSIKSKNINDFRIGKGVFQSNEEFEHYWKNY